MLDVPDRAHLIQNGLKRICKDHITVIYITPQVERGRIEKLRKKQQVLIRWRIASILPTVNRHSLDADLFSELFLL